MQNMQQPGGQPAQFVSDQGAADNKITVFKVSAGPVHVWGAESTS